MANLATIIDAEKYPNSLETLCFEFEPGGPYASIRAAVEEKGGIWYCDSTVDSYRIFAKLNLPVPLASNTILNKGFALVDKAFAQSDESTTHSFGNFYCVNSNFDKNFTHWSGENLLYPSCNDADYTGVIQDPVENPGPTPDPTPETNPEPPIEDGGPACSGNKVQICHLNKTICVSQKALSKGHSKHGDTLGAC